MRLPSRSVRLAALTVLLAVSGCSDATGTQRELSDARALWTASAPARYQVTMRISCFCAPSTTRATVVIVDGNVVIGAHYIDTGEAVPQSALQYIPTVDDLFAEIEQASAQGTVNVTYDNTWGFPSSAYLDPLPNAADDEVAYFLSDFHPL